MNNTSATNQALNDDQSLLKIWLLRNSSVSTQECYKHQMSAISSRMKPIEELVVTNKASTEHEDAVHQHDEGNEGLCYHSREIDVEVLRTDAVLQAVIDTIVHLYKK